MNSYNSFLQLISATSEEVEKYRRLETAVNNQFAIRLEITRRIQAGFCAYYSHKELLRSKNLSSVTKVRKYKTIICPVVLYATEKTCFTNGDEENLRIFERRIIRGICGPRKVDHCSECKIFLVSSSIPSTDCLSKLISC